MDHGATTPHRATHAFGVGDITNDQLDALILWQVLTLASGQIVQHPNGVTACQQCIDQVGADEAGATCDQDRGISHDGNNAPAGSAGRCARHAA